jgi:transposase
MHATSRPITRGSGLLLLSLLSVGARAQSPAPNPPLVVNLRDQDADSGDSDTALAKKLQNPVGDLYSLTLDGKRSLTLLLAANKRLSTAYLLKEAFSRLWDYRREGWARRFLGNWCASLKWQRVKPYERFADMIDRHWNGIAAYCKPENKVSLGFVEGFNAKIRVCQRRAYGLNDEEYLRVKVLSCMLPAL